MTLLMRSQQALLHPHCMESNPTWVQTGVTMLSRIDLHRVRAQYHATVRLEQPLSGYSCLAFREKCRMVDDFKGRLVVFFVMISKIYTSGIRIRTN
jgi:hypothetical protein